MKEYIERAVAVQELEVLRQEYEMHDDCDELVARRCRDALSAVPAADVAEVVRCKDCQYYQDAKINKKGFRNGNYRNGLLLLWRSHEQAKNLRGAGG